MEKQGAFGKFDQVGFRASRLKVGRVGSSLIEEFIGGLTQLVQSIPTESREGWQFID